MSVIGPSSQATIVEAAAPVRYAFRYQISNAYLGFFVVSEETEDAMAEVSIDEAFPHSLSVYNLLLQSDGLLTRNRTIHIPFPTHHLAKAALGSLSVDEELSELVKRSFALVAVEDDTQAAEDESKRILQVHYKATTPRMLRVAVNGFFESLIVIVQVMEELDVDVLHEKGIEGLEGVQGVEQGMTGTAQGVAG